MIGKKATLITKSSPYEGEDTYQLVISGDTLQGKAGHCVFGWANVTVEEDGKSLVDYYGDVIPTDVLEGAAYTFCLRCGIANQEHREWSECGLMIESMVFTKEKREILGLADDAVPDGWFVGFYIWDDFAYQKIIDGEYKMFSIEGRATAITVLPKE